jgi:acyl carrier protein
MSPLDVDAFALALIAEMQISDALARYPEVDLFTDWGLDSLQSFQLVVIIEALAEVQRPPVEAIDIRTLGDAFTYYKALVTNT